MWQTCSPISVSSPNSLFVLPPFPTKTPPLSLFSSNQYIQNNTRFSGLPSSPSSLEPFFPSNTSPQLPLATFLSTLSSLLTPLSPSSELLSAFAAFDDDDSGQIDVHDLRDALLHTSQMDFGSGSDGSHHRAPLSVDDVETVLVGFSGRRAFGGGKGLTAPAKGRGDVFRYRDFVASVTGSGEAAKGRAVVGGA